MHPDSDSFDSFCSLVRASVQENREIDVNELLDHVSGAPFLSSLLLAILESALMIVYPCPDLNVCVSTLLLSLSPTCAPL